MLVPVMALSLLGLFGGRHPIGGEARVTTQVFGVERWRLQVIKDPFAGTTVCRLTAGPARVERGRLIWPLGSSVDSTHAAYRIDQGPPHVQSALALPVTANMTNPSDGLAVVPVAEIAAGRLLEVRAHPGARVRRLDVAGLDQALAAADRVGCGLASNAPADAPVAGLR